MIRAACWPDDPDQPPGTPPAWSCAACGHALAASCPRLTNRCQIDAELVQHRLEIAGATLLSMRGSSGWPASARSAMPETIHEPIEAYGYNATQYRLPPPDSAAISAMDRTWEWLALIPQDRHVVRRIVACRSLVHPLTGRYVLTWRKLSRLLGAHHSAIIRWHAYGIDELVGQLRLRAGKMPTRIKPDRRENMRQEL